MTVLIGLLHLLFIMAHSTSFRVSVSNNTKQNDRKGLRTFLHFISTRPAPPVIRNYNLRCIVSIDAFLDIPMHAMGKYLGAYFSVLRPGLINPNFKYIDIYNKVIVNKHELPDDIVCYKGSSFKQLVSNLCSSLNRKLIDKNAKIVARIPDHQTVPTNVSSPVLINLTNPTLLSVKKVYFPYIYIYIVSLFPVQNL